MKKETFIYESETYERCTLTKARQAYNAGEVVILAPVNANMDYIFGLYMPICKEWATDETYTFKHLLNEYEYYNLGQGLGNYTKYFIKKR